MDTFRDRINRRNSNVIHAFRKLSTEDRMFYARFAPIRLEYLIGHKGLDPAQEMNKQGLKPGG
jgi:hypothetical protein